MASSRKRKHTGLAKPFKSDMLSALLHDKTFIAEEKRFVEYGKQVLGKPVRDVIVQYFKDEGIILSLPENLTAKNFSKFLTTSKQLANGDVADVLILQASSFYPITARPIMCAAAYYFYYRATKERDLIAFGMLGWGFWERSQLDVAGKCFDVSLEQDGEPENIATVGKHIILLETQKNSRSFGEQIKTLTGYYDASVNSQTVAEWHPNISRWLLILAEKFRRGTSLEGASNRFKSQLCYTLSCRYNPMSASAILMRDSNLFSAKIDEEKVAFLLSVKAGVNPGAVKTDEKPSVSNGSLQKLSFLATPVSEAPKLDAGEKSQVGLVASPGQAG